MRRGGRQRSRVSFWVLEGGRGRVVNPAVLALDYLEALEHQRGMTMSQ